MKIFVVFISLFMSSPVLMQFQNFAKSFVDLQNITPCPSFKQNADFSNPADMMKAQNDTLHYLWRNRNPKLTDLGEKFKKEILYLAESSESTQKAYAYATSEWIWGYLPHLDKNINLCPYAQIVNATVAYKEYNDCNAMYKAIESVLIELQNTMLLYRQTAFKKSGCSFDIIPEMQLSLGQSCHENGLVYDFDRMWNLTGSEYPIEYRNIVEELYKSENNIDKIIAVMATSVLSEVMVAIDTQFPQSAKFQLFYSSETESLPTYCCINFISEMGNLILNMAPEAITLIDVIKEYAKCSPSVVMI